MAPSYLTRAAPGTGRSGGIVAAHGLFPALDREREQGIAAAQVDDAIRVVLLRYAARQQVGAEPADLVAVEIADGIAQLRGGRRRPGRSPWRASSSSTRGRKRDFSVIPADSPPTSVRAFQSLCYDAVTSS